MKQALRCNCSLALATAFLLMLSAGPAQARTENLRWLHPDPSSIAGFRVHVGAASGIYLQTIDVGLPLSGSEYAHSLTISDGASVYVAVTAYDASGLESVLSNESFRPALLGAPGRPVVVGD